jgi:hypothetical protein
VEFSVKLNQLDIPKYRIAWLKDEICDDLHRTAGIISCFSRTTEMGYPKCAQIMLSVAALRVCNTSREKDRNILLLLTFYDVTPATNDSL